MKITRTLGAVAEIASLSSGRFSVNVMIYCRQGSKISFSGLFGSYSVQSGRNGGLFNCVSPQHDDLQPAPAVRLGDNVFRSPGQKALPATSANLPERCAETPEMWRNVVIFL